MADKGGLLDSDSDSEQETEKLLINKKFAKEYDARKQKLELRTARLRGEAPEEDSEDDETEDEDGDLLTTRLDTDIMKTLNALRSKDETIYNPETRFFDGTKPSEDDEGEDSDEELGRKDKPKRYKDVVREQILEEMEKGTSAIAHDGDNDDKDEGKKQSYRSELAYDDEQREIRKAFLSSTTKDSDDDDDLMVVKHTHKGDKGDGNDEEFLTEIEKMEKSLRQGNREPSNIVDPKGEVKDGEKFLLEFFKKRSWIDQDQIGGEDSDDSDDQNDDENVPMKGGAEGKDGHESDDSLEQLDQTDDFESQYNFRFEAAAAAGGQSGADFSNVGYARGQLMNTLRRPDETRRQKRVARKERKEAERRAKEEQLKRLKNAKRQELERNVAEIKKVLGEYDVKDGAVDEAAILKMMEGDYDPDKLEQLMNETFGDEYYEREDAKWKSDKDVREDLAKDEDGEILVGDDEQGGLYDDENDDDDDEPNERAERGQDETEEDDWVEEEEFGDDYYNSNAEEQEETELEKKIKTKMEDELYKLDYEDIVAGMPTRFKYRTVEANDYGLTTEEILLARDTTLRQYVSLKKMAPYREDGEHVVSRSKRRAFRDVLERDLEELAENEPGPSTTDEKQPTPESEGGSKKKKRRKKKKKGTDVDVEAKSAGADKESEATQTEPAPSITKTDGGTDEEENDAAQESASKKSKRRRRKKKSKKEDEGENSEAPQASEKLDAEKKVETTSDEHGTISKTATNEAKQTDGLAEKSQDIVEKKKKRKSEKRRTDGDLDRDSKKNRKKSKKSKVEGITSSRLGSYGL
uniref:Kri1-like C-terminal domain-containing protein n=2 Tax=Entomoneis paludosa TaxID=265537 RepID=A0A7S2VCY1_9STRA